MIIVAALDRLLLYSSRPSVLELSLHRRQVTVYLSGVALLGFVCYDFIRIALFTVRSEILKSRRVKFLSSDGGTPEAK